VLADFGATIIATRSGDNDPNPETTKK
jgi:hypothetical protein